MIDTLKKVLQEAVGRLDYQITTYLPPFLAALTLVLGMYLLALLARKIVYAIFKGLAMDRFLRQSGIAFLVDPSGRLRATRLVAETVYWGILLCGILLGLNVFGTDMSTKMVQGFVF